MATKKKMLQAAAGNAGGEALDITDVFSTYLYEGNDSTQTISNGIDLDGEGGLVWIKARDTSWAHRLSDTVNGAGQFLDSSSTNAIAAGSIISTFNSNGFTTGDSTTVNNSLYDYASWTFRKAPKFFDVVTYTGDGTGNRIISHGLNSTPGMLVVRPYDAVSDWFVNHRGNGTAGLKLNTTDATAFSPVLSLDGNLQWDSTTVTLKTNFNNSGVSYVAYVFAHNDGDGGFGPNGDQDIIKCGSYTGNSGGAINVELGFEPQWLMIKNASSNSNWVVLDVMRGFSWDAGNNLVLNANADHAEQDVDENGAPRPTPTGFSLASSNQYGEYNSGSDTYIYMAIRRGPLAPPESATEVFDITSFSSSEASTTNRPDVLLWRQSLTSSSSNEITSRLTAGKILATDLTSAEYDASGTYAVDLLNDGVKLGSSWGNFPWALSWTRAPGFFDVVAYTGDGVAGRTVSHNLGVAPEMMWVKSRTEVYSWEVYHEALGNRAYLALEETSAAQINTPDSWNNTSPTDTNFTLGASWFGNKSNGDYIAYLFATVPGVSKVGSYTGNGSSQTIDCGFTSGARFVLIKRTDSTGSWVVYDTERGIVSGNDAALLLQSSGAEYSGADEIDPNSSGFDVVHDANGFLTNASGASYIFYAIA